MLSVTEALQQILQHADPITDTESLALLQAHGRVLAAPQYSTLDVPPADNSAMDGYAFRYADHHQQGPQTFAVSQRITAGSPPQPLQTGTAARIFTGAEIPAGADTVVMQEQCEADKDAATVQVPAGVELNNNIRPRGQDIRSGAEVAAAGDLLTPQRMGLLASIGVAEVPVYRRLRVAIMSTGDELTEPGQPLSAGKIYNSNRYLLAGLIAKMGMELVDLGCVADNAAATEAALERAAASADVIISSGGVSVGEEDHVKNAVEKLGTLQLWKIAIKPGKPVAFGKIGTTPFFGLPGNPVSTFITFLLFARPFLQRLQGQQPVAFRGQHFPASFNRRKASVRREFMRVRMDDAGRMHTHPNQSSGVLTSTSWSNGLAVLEENRVIQEGDPVEVIFYDQLF
ncbi:molybdopterin molybdenumtransferase MoeA [Pseudomaricurvus sp. HS19]|nr:molybdopterin molybdenumtransferase MoeA [Pseudomaricurvus sp. HS19]